VIQTPVVPKPRAGPVLYSQNGAVIVPFGLIWLSEENTSLAPLFHCFVVPVIEES